MSEQNKGLKNTKKIIPKQKYQHEKFFFFIMLYKNETKSFNGW